MKKINLSLVILIALSLFGLYACSNTDSMLDDYEATYNELLKMVEGKSILQLGMEMSADPSKADKLKGLFKKLKEQDDALFKCMEEGADAWEKNKDSSKRFTIPQHERYREIRNKAWDLESQLRKFRD